MITFHDPRGEIGQAVEEYSLHCDLNTSAQQGDTVALLANGFPDSENFLNAIGRSLAAKLPGLNLKLWNKGNASIPAPDTMLSEIGSQAQVAIAAYGH